MSRQREYELKFSMDPAALMRVADHPALAGAVAGTRREHLVSTYYDTADDDLRRRHVTLRVRRSESGTVHTLKRAGGSLVDRDEWETRGGSEPDVAWLHTTPLAPLFADGAVTTALDRRFTVDVSRTILPIDYDGTRIEGAIDLGAIQAGGHRLPVSEVELELKDGPRDGVVRLGRELARDLPLVLSLVSKSERGFALADASWGRPTKTIPLDLSGARTLPELFTAVLQACLHTLCRNAALIGGADDGDAVHKTRIALRHIRAALALFAPVLRRKRLARLERDVKWASDRLGAARDADVFRQLATRDGGSSPLAAALEPRRRRAHARLKGGLASARWRLLLIDLVAFSIEGVRRSRRTTKAGPFARRRIHVLRAGLAQDARDLHRASPDARHDLRKRAKMLRYDLDLVGGLPRLDVRGKHLRRTGEDLHALQETLGTIHDAEAFGARLEETVLSRHRPSKGIGAEDWSRIAQTARALREPATDAAALRKATKAARRLRRRAF